MSSKLASGRKVEQSLACGAFALALCAAPTVRAAPGGLLRAADAVDAAPGPTCLPCAALPPRQSASKTPAGAPRGQQSAAEVWDGPRRLPPSAPRLANWVRPVAGAYAAGSAAVLLGISQTEPPNLALSLRHAPSALFSSGLMLGVAGGAGSVLIRDHHARPLLELTVASSMSLQGLGAAQAPEHGVPALGEYAVASGYALTALLLGVDWALSPRASMLDVSARTTEREVPRRALSPYVVYTPALLGALVSLSRAFSPTMSGDERELTLGLGGYALLPAATAFVAGVVSSRRSRERSLDTFVSAGPRGSLGLTIGGSL